MPMSVCGGETMSAVVFEPRDQIAYIPPTLTAT